MIPPLVPRFVEHVGELEKGVSPRPVVVAASAGLDSTVLLHLVRFHLPETPKVIAAHFDHGMRRDSASDARWLAGLCRCWGIKLYSQRALKPPASEEEARNFRYDFLSDVRAACDGAVIMTAHHADDQAETVLFRILRGTGLHGLRGIPPQNDRKVVRPLLPFWKEELKAYAHACGISWRTDASNLSSAYARNRIRHTILPVLESEFPAARSNLISLAAMAAEAEDALKDVVDSLYLTVVRSEGSALRFDREALSREGSAIASRILRKALSATGVRLDRPGTRSAIQFITDAPSGRIIHLPGSLRLRTDFGFAWLEPDVEDPPSKDDPAGIVIPRLDAGATTEQSLCVGGSGYRVVASRSASSDRGPVSARWETILSLSDRRFPLQLRGRQPGDRFRTRGGTKSLKKLMIEGQVSAQDRYRLPVLLDVEGNVIWVAGWDAADEGSDANVAMNLAIYDA